ncbi:MAG: (Fe-S)-binding protein [Candidatus Eremiobacteraeota bacterium]|nr:(Fe-S)-binding protein [Candidatus Eremiobacteraeota bacterium]
MELRKGLPGLDCGLCGYRLCSDLSEKLDEKPDLIKRCIHLSKESFSVKPEETVKSPAAPAEASPAGDGRYLYAESAEKWRDSLGRDFDFYLEHFPEDPGPREIIIPRNPMRTRELSVQIGDTLIGRPLGMSCGCPITHCGIVSNVDSTTGVIVWCVTGPLKPRSEGYKDLGYYSAEGYEGLIHETRTEIKIGMRYYFQPRMCMLQWRHSGLVNYLSKTAEGIQVRLEGLWIG